MLRACCVYVVLLLVVLGIHGHGTVSNQFRNIPVLVVGDIGWYVVEWLVGPDPLSDPSYQHTRGLCVGDLGWLAQTPSDPSYQHTNGVHPPH